MKIEELYIDGKRYYRSVEVVTVSPVEGAAKLTPEDSGLKSAVAGIGGGAIAKYSWTGFQASNALTHDQVVAGLVANGVAPSHAPGIADTALKIIQAEPTKVLLVAIAAGGGTWALLEAGGKLFGWRLTKARKIALILVGAALAVVLYLFLRLAGVMR
jgi:hypothetical protein